MTTSTTIIKVEEGWKLEIVTLRGSEKRTTSIIRKKLIDVMDIADILQLHIDNEDTLPLQQYRKTG